MSEQFIVNPEGPHDPELRKEIESAVDQVLDGNRQPVELANAADVFEEEPDTRDDFEKALDEVDPEMQGYLKAVRGIVQPGIHAMTTYKPKTLEFKAVLFDLSEMKGRWMSEEKMNRLISEGWSLRQDLSLHFQGHFLATFCREKQPESSVEKEPKSTTQS